jgi:hypothetical protein
MNNELLRQLVAGFTTRRPGFEARSGHFGFVVYKVALWWVISDSSVSPANSQSTNCSVLMNHHIINTNIIVK